MFKVIMIKGVISDKIMHFVNSDNDYYDNVILSHDNVITWGDNVIM
jgi:hypothetical protein